MYQTASRARVTAQVKITDTDRLGMTFLLAAIFHGIIILGVTFSYALPTDNQSVPSLDIILVQSHTKTTTEIEDADFLSQISQQGGGNQEKKSRQRDLFSAPTLSDKTGMAIQSQQQQIAQQKQNEDIRLIKQNSSAFKIYKPAKQTSEDNQQEIQQILTREMQTARLAAEISDSITEHSHTGKTKFLNSSTKEFIPARYMKTWIDRVERVGNLNYPDRARRKKLNGTLILDVTIKSNGQLIKTDLRQSSGHQVLDDAAKRIVRLAAPYPPFPEELRQQADVIHITRSWVFLNDSGLRTR